MTNIWTAWLDLITTALNFLASDVGLGLGLSIVVLTVLLRTALIPASWSAAYAGGVRQKKMKLLQPEMEALKAKHSGKPEIYSREMMKLYQSYGLKLVDGRSFLVSLAQLPVFFGMFRVLRGMGNGVRFLWIPDLPKPNVVLAIIVGLTTAIMIAVNPDMPEQTKMLMPVISSVVALASALHVGSALGLYWATSSLFSAAQTIAVHKLIKRRMQSGALKI